MGRAVTSRGRQKQREAGQRGGQTTLSRYGSAHFAALSKQAVAARGAVSRPVRPELKVRVDPEQLSDLRAVAASAGVSLSHIVRDAVALWLQEWEEAKAVARSHRTMGEWKKGQGEGEK